MLGEYIPQTRPLTFISAYSIMHFLCIFIHHYQIHAGEVRRDDGFTRTNGEQGCDGRNHVGGYTAVSV